MSLSCTYLLDALLPQPPPRGMKTASVEAKSIPLSAFAQLSFGQAACGEACVGIWGAILGWVQLERAIGPPSLTDNISVIQWGFLFGCLNCKLNSWRYKCDSQPSLALLRRMRMPDMFTSEWHLLEDKKPQGIYFGVLSAWVCCRGEGRVLTYVLLINLFCYKTEYILC